MRKLIIMEKARDAIKKEKGFTLVELALVLIVFGLIVVSVMAGFTLYNKQSILERTASAVENSNSGLFEYVGNFGVYPCPADPTARPGDANYGREMRDTTLPPSDSNYDLAPCATTPNIHEVPGADVEGDGTNEKVLIGALPAITIAERILGTDYLYSNFSDRDSTDGWGRKLTYAVTKQLTQSSSFDDTKGAIEIVDEHDKSLVTKTETDANGNGIVDPAEDPNGNQIFDQGHYPHFVLVSHGENGRGAYMREGTKVSDCASGTTIPTTPPVGMTAVTEIENCNHATDGKFMSGLLTQSDLSYNDDTAKFSSYMSSALWRYTGQDKIENTNSGNVGIGTNKPSEALHVAGTISAERARALLYTDRVASDNINLPADAIGGNGTTPESLAMQCANPGEVVVKIQGEKIGTDAYGNDIIRPKVTCAIPFGTNPPEDYTCPVVGGIQYIMSGMEIKKDNPSDLIGKVVPLCCDPSLPAGGPEPACR